MLDPTNYLNNLNKRIEITSSEIGNVQLKESFVLNSRRNAIDLNSIGDYLNEVIVKSYATLCSNPRYPKDAVVNGLSGMTMVTWLEEDGNNKFNSPAFWFSSENPDIDGRPCTIKESIQYLWENLNERVIQTQGQEIDLSPLEDAISCLSTMLTQLKTDAYGENFILDCGGAWSKQKWSISKHVFEVLSQLTIGHDVTDLAGLNHGETDYPSLNWNIELNDLLDVDIVSVPPNSGDALIWNEESQQWQPGKGHIEYITELNDVDTTTQAPEANDVLVWDPDHKDSNGSNAEGYSGAWVPKSPTEVFGHLDTKIQYIDELKDVEIGSEELGNGYVLTWDESVVDNTDSNNTQVGAWVPRPLPDPTVDTKVEYLNELKDVNLSYPLNNPTDANFILKFNPESEDTEAGITGRWEAANLNDFIPEEIDLTTNIGQRIGGARRDSTLDDVYSVSEITETWLTENGLTDASEATLEQNLDLTKRSASRFRAGASLSYDGNIWHSKLTGNTSNLNEVEFIPEIHLKGSDYIDGLSSVEKERLVFGGYNAIPFVFVNNFDVKMKELVEPNYRGIIAYSQRGEIPLTDNENLNLLSQNFDENSIGSILNSTPTSSSRILENEIATNTPNRPIGSMKVSEKYTDQNGIERVYYKPEKVLGVCRTDMDSYSFPAPGIPATPNFIEDAEGNLTGEISPFINYGVQLKVARNVGIGVQHSGYSRVMVLGPYVHGDNLYICPAPVLEVAGINYPYGICISDTFMNTPLKELFLGELDNLLSSSYPTIYAEANLSIYDLIANALTVVDSELRNKILSCPVAFVTRDDSPFTSLDISLENNSTEEIENHNVANVICRNLLSINNTGASTGGAIYVAILDYFNNINSAERYNYQSDVVHAAGGSLVTKYIFNAGSLHLPLCKIATGSFNHEGVNQTINNFDWATYLNPVITDGYLYLAGSLLGSVVGQDGTNGINGVDGTNGVDGQDGKNAPIVINGTPIIHYDEGKVTIPAGYNLIPSTHNLYHIYISKSSYPSLDGPFGFTLQLRFEDLHQDIKVKVYNSTQNPDSNDPPLTFTNPVEIRMSEANQGTTLALTSQTLVNGFTAEITSKENFDISDGSNAIFNVEISTTEENTVGLQEVCAAIYTNFIITQI